MEAFVDVGKSGSRLQVVERGSIRALTAKGASPAQPGNSGLVIAEQIVEMLKAADATSATHVLVGATVRLTVAEQTDFVALVREAAPDAVLGLTDDATLSHARHLNQPGVLLAVGTGVIAIAHSPEGVFTRFDGWGPLAGDRGSAADVGRWALREAFRDVDESRASELRNRVEAAVGPIDLELAASILTDENWPAVLAGLAQAVCELADAGDAQAGGMLELATDELARTVILAVTSATAPRVVVTGRFGGAQAVRSRLTARLGRAGITVVDALPPAAVAASDILSGPYSGAFLVEGGR